MPNHGAHSLRSRFLSPARSTALAALACSAAMVAAAQPAPPHTVPDTMQQRLLACTACHGKDGRATSQGYFPRIAGKPAGYLYNQLLNFREGRRNNGAMNTLVEHLSDAYLRQIAEYFAEQDLPYPPPQAVGAPASLLAAGERLVMQGDKPRDLPACVACHGAAMMGVAPSVPGLLGLPRDYVVGQLGAWRTGLRKTVAPDCMGRIAQTLTRDDVLAVSTWLASQPVPAGAKPAAPTTMPLPMACGSATR
jgi:cytochrome c553